MPDPVFEPAPEPTIRFLPPAYEFGRRILLCGQIEAGAVFAPASTAPEPYPWVWRLWIGGQPTKDGRAKSETAAKVALSAALGEWLHRAGLQVKK